MKTLLRAFFMNLHLSHLTDGLVRVVEKLKRIFPRLSPPILVKPKIVNKEKTMVLVALGQKELNIFYIDQDLE